MNRLTNAYGIAWLIVEIAAVVTAETIRVAADWAWSER